MPDSAQVSIQGVLELKIVPGESLDILTAYIKHLLKRYENIDNYLLHSYFTDCKYKYQL